MKEMLPSMEIPDGSSGSLLTDEEGGYCGGKPEALVISYPTTAGVDRVDGQYKINLSNDAVTGATFTLTLSSTLQIGEIEDALTA